MVSPSPETDYRGAVTAAIAEATGYSDFWEDDSLRRAVFPVFRVTDAGLSRRGLPLLNVDVFTDVADPSVRGTPPRAGLPQAAAMVYLALRQVCALPAGGQSRPLKAPAGTNRELDGARFLAEYPSLEVTMGITEDELNAAIAAAVDAHAALPVIHHAPPGLAGLGSAVWAAHAESYDPATSTIAIQPNDPDFNPVWGQIVLFINADTDDSRDQAMIQFGGRAVLVPLQDRDGVPVAPVQLVSERIYIGYVVRHPLGGPGAALRISEELEAPSPIDDHTRYAVWTPTEALPTGAFVVANASTSMTATITVPLGSDQGLTQGWTWLFDIHDDISSIWEPFGFPQEQRALFEDAVGLVIGGVQYYGYRSTGELLAFNTQPSTYTLTR